MKLKLVIYQLFLVANVLLLACNSQGNGRIVNVSTSSDEFAQYAKAEFEVELIAEWDDPYVSTDIALDMLLLTPGGREITLPCFYVKGESRSKSLWKARFMAQEVGTYTYSFRLTHRGQVVDQSATMKFVSIPSHGRGILRPNNLWTFAYDNGEVFRGIGENLCWESRDADDNKYLGWLHEDPRFNYSYMLNTLASNGGNFFRVWMIYWNLPVDWKVVKNNRRYQNSNQRLNPSGIERMDYLVNLSDSLGLHFMLALQAHGALLGSGWDINSYNVKQGGPAQTPYEFFTLPAAREMYKDKLRYLVARWGYSPAIGAWEFFNEVDNAMYNVPEGMQLPHSIVTDWHVYMSNYLKSIDPYGRLVTTSISHRDVEGLNDIPAIDFNQKHIYRNTASIPATINEYVKRHGKPYVIGEFGYEWDWHVNFFDIAEGKESDFKRGLWYGLFSPTPILPMSWWWEFFDERGLKGYFNHVRTISNRMIESGGGSFKQIETKFSSSHLVNYSVLCGNKLFVYAYNPTSRSITTSASIPLSSSSNTVEIFNCEEGIYIEPMAIKVNGGTSLLERIMIPAKTDRVFVIDIN